MNPPLANIPEHFTIQNQAFAQEKAGFSTLTQEKAPHFVAGLPDTKNAALY
jgi:hypothetical protein